MVVPRRRIFALPPGGALYSGPDGTLASIALWLHWLVIARSAAAQAVMMRPSDAAIDAFSARIAGIERQLPEDANRGSEEMHQAMVAISAAAHSLDGFYGSVVDLVKPPRSAAKRERQILEVLKLGFSIGRRAHVWLNEVDWLFGVRDDIVHHGERLRPAVQSRVTSETVVFAGPEAFDLSSDSATRASDLATTILRECVVRPKEPLREWAERASQLMSNTLGPPDN